jgi:pimeloyl-ACP methyl ester carboxylesterase
VERLVAISPAGVVADRPSFVLRAFANRLLGERGARRTLELVFSPHKLPPKALAAMVAGAREFRPRFGIVPRFSDDELRHITMPVLLVGGEQDALRDVRAIARRMAGLLPRLEVELIPNAGHALPASAGRVLPFLSEADAVEAALAKYAE